MWVGNYICTRKHRIIENDARYLYGDGHVLGTIRCMHLLVRTGIRTLSYIQIHNIMCTCIYQYTLISQCIQVFIIQSDKHTCYQYSVYMYIMYKLSFTSCEVSPPSESLESPGDPSLLYRRRKCRQTGDLRAVEHW